MDCQEDNFRLVDLPDPGGSRNAIHSGHIDVEQDDIRSQFADFFESFGAVLSLAADLERIQVQERTDGPASGGVIVNDQYSRRQSCLPESLLGIPS